jgi:hypothetical protein
MGTRVPDSIVGNDFWTAYQHFYPEAARQHIALELSANANASALLASNDSDEFSEDTGEVVADFQQGFEHGNMEKDWMPGSAGTDAGGTGSGRRSKSA